MDSPHKGPVTREMFAVDDVIMESVFLIFQMPYKWEPNLVSNMSADVSAPNNAIPSADSLRINWTSSSLSGYQ